MNSIESVDAMTRLLTKAHPVTDELTISLAGWVIAVRSNSIELIQDLKDYFEPFVTQPQSPHLMVFALETPELDTGLRFTIKQPDPGKSKIKEEWADLPGGRVVRKRLTGMIFAFGPGHHLAAGPCLANSNQVVNFVNNRLIQMELNQGCLLAHAAGIRTGSTGVALAGFSGMGKSTLALHLMSKGVTFISNDRLLVQRGGGRAQMIGVPKLPRINPGTALNNPDLAGVIPPEEKEQFAALTTDEIWDLEHKYDVDIAQCFGPYRFELKSPLDALAILNWQRNGSGLVVQEVDLNRRLDLLAAFKKDWGLFFLAGEAEPDHSDQAYLAALQGVRVFELTGGVDFLGAADRLLEQVEKLA
jgi:HprK-related kinase B